MSQTENTPNFDDMSPDEIMAWMESLAKRQGANEGFTTAADVEIPDIDPDTVVIDEPGYVPYEESLRQPKPASTAPSTPPPAPMTERPAAPPPAPAPIPSFARVSPPPAPLPLFTAPAPPPAAPVPPPQVASLEPQEEVNLGSAIGDNAMAWLQSLAADQDSADFSLDLSSLDDELNLGSLASSPPPAPVQATIDPQSWLESITQEANADTSFDIPQTPAPPRQPAMPLENPTSLLDSFASEAGFMDDAVRAAPGLRTQSADEMTVDAIERAIREGRVTTQQMKRYQELQMERASHIPEPEIEEDLEPEAEPADLPDWLEELNPESQIEQEQKLKRAAGQLTPLESILEESLPKAQTGALNVPDWLQDDDALSETAASIFADTSADERPAIVVDEHDPWVEALDEEYAHGQVVEEPPAWYLQNINDPERISRVETSTIPQVRIESTPEPAREVDEMPAVIQLQISSVQLADAALPVETSLRAGERQSVPGWMTGTSTGTIAAVAVPLPEPLTTEDLSAGTPDWLRATDEQPAAILDWHTTESAEPVQPVITLTPPPAPPAAPPPPMPAASGSLQEARARYQGGDAEGSLAIYEMLVRAGQSLVEVASDLTSIAGSSKNPVAYRVLGDSLMRQGKLQDALNTYRQALNLL